MAAVDARIRRLVDDMLETMYAADGVGLAATQVDVHERVIVIDISEERDQPLVLINPEIVWGSEEMQVNEEGCLSVPTIYDGVERHRRVHVRALDAQGAVRRSRPKACWRCACSTRWTTCWARSSSSTSGRSSATASDARC